MDVGTQSFKSGSASSRIRVRILSTRIIHIYTAIEKWNHLKGLQETVVSNI